MSNKAKKTGPRDSQKVSRGEMKANFVKAGEDINRLQLALSWVADLLIEKQVISQEELTAWFAKQQAEATAAYEKFQQAQLIPPPAEAPCQLEDSSTKTPLLVA